MLVRANRITKPAQFRNILSQGRRISSPHLIVNFSFDKAQPNCPPRVGFIVGKNCGSAVQRNKLKRRLRAICASKLNSLEGGSSWVVRALPAAQVATYATLESEFAENVDRARRKFAELMK